MSFVMLAEGAERGMLAAERDQLEVASLSEEGGDSLAFDSRRISYAVRDAPWRAHKAILGLSGLAFVVVLVFGAVRPSSTRTRSDGLLGEHVLPLATEEVAKARLCGPAAVDTDFVYDGDWFNRIEHVTSVEACCDECQKEAKCEGITWVKKAEVVGAGDAGQCWLKSGLITSTQEEKGVISCAMHAAPTEDTTEKPTTTTEKPTTTTVATTTTPEPTTTTPTTPSPYAHCADRGESCLGTKCCRAPGTQCYTKNAFWAQCMVSCAPGPNPLDQVSPLPWACKPLGDRTPGEPKACSTNDEDCSTTKCCLKAGTQCFEKNASFAQCKPSCEKGPDLSAQDWLPWSCRPLGSKTLGAAPWVGQKCAHAGADCRTQACCADPGHQCYLQSQYWGECKPSCEEGKPSYAGGKPWACTLKGMRTPSVANEAAAKKGTVGPWVVKRCSSAFASCLDSQCCTEVNAQCFTKTKSWGACKTSCSTDPDPHDGNKTWDCKALGPRGWGLATKGYPSLFCITLYMPSRYEGPLLRAHLKANVGIFQCDGYDVFAAENDTLGTSGDGIEVKAQLIAKISVGVSQDGTAGNAKLFMAVWDKIIAGGRFRNYDWTIKVDPDAVIIAWRIRSHMLQHVGKNAYVVNCNKFPGSPNFPMMFGAVEIFSNLAMGAYAMGSWKCGSKLPWAKWGEDYYMTHCLDFLGVGRINDFGVLGDNVCTGANCLDTNVGSFHPFKDNNTWFKCWTQATDPAALAP